MITTHVVGNLFVIVDPDGDLETIVAGQTTLDWVAIYTLLRGTFGDHYDFLSCYLDTGSGVVYLGAASDTIYQDAAGIGRWTFNFRSSWGTAKLQHWSHFSFFTLNTMLHEIGHRWLAAQISMKVMEFPATTSRRFQYVQAEFMPPVHWWPLRFKGLFRRVSRISPVRPLSE